MPGCVREESGVMFELTICFVGKRTNVARRLVIRNYVRHVDDARAFRCNSTGSEAWKREAGRTLEAQANTMSGGQSYKTSPVVGYTRSAKTNDPRLDEWEAQIWAYAVERASPNLAVPENSVRRAVAATMLGAPNELGGVPLSWPPSSSAC